MLNMTIKKIENYFEFGFFEDKAFSKKEERIEKKKENTEKDYFTITNLVNINGEIVKAIFYFIVDGKIGATTYKQEFILEFTPGKGFVFKPRINLPSKTVIRKMDCLFSF